MKRHIEKSLSQAMREWRHHLHSIPEVSGEEEQTAAYVLGILSGLTPDHLMDSVGGHGVVAEFRGDAPGPTLLFRAELDALPIKEENEFPWRSGIEGISHTCGHDGHTAVLLGLARLLSEKRPSKGSVYLLFQPAEEDGSGAEAVVNDPVFKDIRPDFSFAFHNLPGYPLGATVVREGAFTASVRSLIIKLQGKTSHAAEPEMGINPAAAIAELLREMDALNRPDVEDEEFALLTPVCVRMGELAYGISAGYGELHYTLRCWTPEAMKKLAAKCIALCGSIALKHRLILDSEWTNIFHANFNDLQTVNIIRQTARNRGLQVIERSSPLKWGEDFGAIIQLYKGAMFGIGAGEGTPALHNPDYDFPDGILETVLGMFAGICDELLD